MPLLRSAILSLSALFTALAVTAAWFASNTRTGSGGTEASIQSVVSFELASAEGVSGVYGTIPTLNFELGAADTIGDRNVRVTTEENPHARWMVSGESHFSNISAASKLQPGVSGQIEFYVVPPASGVTYPADVTLRLAMTPYDAERALIEYDALTGNGEIAAQLLRGHILFFREKTGAVYSQPIPDGSTFTVTCTSAEPVPVTLYWCWPRQSTDLAAIEAIQTSIGQHPELYYYRPAGLESDDEAYDKADMAIGQTVAYISLGVSIE